MGNCARYRGDTATKTDVATRGGIGLFLSLYLPHLRVRVSQSTAVCRTGSHLHRKVDDQAAVTDQCVATTVLKRWRGQSPGGAGCEGASSR